MANRFLGETTATTDAGSFTLRMDINAMCEFEEATGIPAMDAFASAEQNKVSVPMMRQMVRAALLHHHPDATLQDAGNILSEDPEALQRVILAAAPVDQSAPGKRQAGSKRAV